MDEAASRLRIEIDSMPQEIDLLAQRKYTQMQIEEQALMKENDPASAERLEELRKQMATSKEWLDARKAEWRNEKDVIEKVQTLKADIDAAHVDEEKATREGDLVKASEIRYAKIPELQRQLAEAEEAERQAGRRRHFEVRGFRRGNRRSRERVDGYSRVRR